MGPAPPNDVSTTTGYREWARSIDLIEWIGAIGGAMAAESPMPPHLHDAADLDQREFDPTGLRAWARWSIDRVGR